MLPVAAAGHALAQTARPLSHSDVCAEVQIVIAQRAPTVSETAHSSVISTKTWRVADATTKLGLIRAGLGWGYLPIDRVAADIERGTLVRLVLQERGREPMLVPLSAISLSDSPPGPAGRWLLDRLASIFEHCPQAEPSAAS
jgi:DNA-binding transcriptional LysR family regulator